MSLSVSGDWLVSWSVSVSDSEVSSSSKTRLVQQRALGLIRELVKMVVTRGRGLVGLRVGEGDGEGWGGAGEGGWLVSLSSSLCVAKAAKRLVGCWRGDWLRVVVSLLSSDEEQVCMRSRDLRCRLELAMAGGETMCGVGWCVGVGGAVGGVGRLEVDRVLQGGE